MGNTKDEAGTGIQLVVAFILAAQATATQPTVTLPDTGTVISGEQKTVSLPQESGGSRIQSQSPILPPQINATHFPPPCFQRRFNPNDNVNKNMSEDCLYLNIWAPTRRSNMAVLIHFYGGSFEYGSTDLYENNPQYLAARTDMVVVSFNYRLSSFGFLNLSRDGYNGNLGLKDQIAALKWVNKHIELFGGDPKRVLLYGLSSGSISIAFLFSNKENDNLFKRAFLQSGTSNSGYLNITNSGEPEALKRFYEVLNCDPKSPEILTCLQSKSADKILEADNAAASVNNHEAFGPKLDGKLISFTTFQNFYKKNILLYKDIIIGTTKDEGSLAQFITNPYFVANNLTKEEALEYLLNMLGKNNSLMIDIGQYYFKDVPEYDFVKYGYAVKGLVQDLIFRCPIYYFANIMASKHNSVFFYLFTYQTEYKAKNNVTKILGATHGEDQQYVLGLPQRDSLPYTEKEIEFSNRIMDYVGNFAKFGTLEYMYICRTISTSSHGAKWLQASMGNTKDDAGTGIQLAVAFLLAAQAIATQPTVTLPDSGTVISGEQKTVSGKSLDVYLSIPFAQPPTGERRFKDPEPITNLPPQINATHFPPPCFQRRFNPNDNVNKNMSEDCLYLNIWAPTRRSNMAVLIHFYGGSFEYGSTDLYENNPQYLAARTDMVVVSFNYRLSSFGFLNLSRDGYNGNLGLKDQIAALKWVNKHIELFGGDPKRVLLYGLSSGSISIAFLFSNKENDNLFKRAFLQSGTSNSGYLNITNSGEPEALKRFYEVLNCDPKSPEILTCLQSKSADKILEADNAAASVNNHEAFGPKLDGYIIGTTKDEGSLAQFITNPYFVANNLTKEEALEYLLNMLGKNNSLMIDIGQYYFKNVPEYDFVKYGYAVKGLVQDLIFRCPIYYFANIMASKHNNVFFYLFTYQTEYKAKNNVTKILGATHGEDQQYVLGLPQRDSLPYTEKEIQFSNRIMDYVGNFAKFGLLQEDDEVKLERVFALAVSYELAEKDAKELHGRKVARVTSHIERNRKSKYSPTKKNFTSSTKERTCYRCGMKNSHLAPACPHKSKACYKCKKIGHLSKVCKAANYALKNSYVHEQILSLKGETEAKVTLTLDGNVLKCIVDTGSPVTLMPKTIFKKFWKVKLFPTSKNLKTLCNNPIKLVGERDVFVEETGKKLRLIVVDEGFPEVLLGREWLKFLNINYSKLLNVNKISESCIDSLIESYANLFNNELGCLKDVKLNICIKRDAAPVFCKARSLPFAMKKKVEDELEDMVDKGILEPLDYADWAAPIVPILKKDGARAQN
ncbi:CES2 [Cordylochernes scorpioides]|uniref:CES2 n=1 Tax=Cordylochernes scorpioides TaxID=51811 RepID=A0ABY6LBF2_9ARAC|nr:CES2 [Cordylochernes scorpioides]